MTIMQDRTVSTQVVKMLAVADIRKVEIVERLT
jgi:hypothetical protein